MSSNILSYGNGLPSDYLGNIVPRDTYVQPVVLPLYEPIGGIGPALDLDIAYVSTLGVSSITGEFLDNDVDMRSVNLAISTLNGGSSGTLSTVAGIDLAVTSTSVTAFRQAGGVGGLQVQGNVIFGVSTLATQFSNTVYRQIITVPSTIRGVIATNQGNIICTALQDSAGAGISTPLTAIQSSTPPYTSFEVYGQQSTKFAFMISQPDQNVV